MPSSSAEVHHSVCLCAGDGNRGEADGEVEKGHHLDGLLAAEGGVHLHAAEVLVQVIDALWTGKNKVWLIIC